jgi:hypothetical protein
MTSDNIKSVLNCIKTVTLVFFVCVTIFAITYRICDCIEATTFRDVELVRADNSGVRVWNAGPELKEKE